ncbi:coiled-coil domain-containing protein 177 [Thamnophis elegans]|uniref:coiled-coil domain-containing protein 177 n=1 Tax=Thamnophis elegans TaxID=35005 RepID=UPI001376A007|nr:coiled-coil domain-containing protein 177 [Thamnophis elegans]
MVDPVADPGKETCPDPGGAAGGEDSAAAATSATTEAAVQPPAPPPAAAPPRIGEPEKIREESPMLHLDLYNFDCPEAEGSRYVLTSPRSLEACARSAVKPVELLPRPLSELIKEAPGRSMRVAAGLYEAYEMDRQRKLQQCREERERIIREEKRRLFTPVLTGSLPSSPASRTASKSTLSDGSCPPSGKPKTAGGHPPPPLSGPKTKKSHSLDSLQKRREGFSTKTSSDSGASSSYSGDSGKDKWTQGLPRTKNVATMTSLVGRSFSLSDLSHSPQTTQKVERIVREVRQKKGFKEVSDRDRKIAALMIAKHQEENLWKEQRYTAHLQWDVQRRVVEQRRELEEREKQLALVQGRRMWETRLEKRRDRLTHTWDEAVQMKQRQTLMEDEKWREHMEKQERLKRNRLGKAALEDKKRKRHQEHNLKAQEENKKEVQVREVQLLQEKLTLAAQKKLLKEQLIQKEKKLLNQADKQKHQTILKGLAKQEAEERAVLRAAMEGNLSKAQEKYEQLIEKRNQELKERGKREDLQIQRAKLAAERKDREQKEHLRALAQASERKLQHAAQVVEEVAQQKARKVVQNRLEKEKMHKVNKKKVDECEDIRRREILLSIEKKLERSEQICKEKKNVLESAKSVARASFHVREKVREEMNMRTFDKMAFEAELQATLVKK